MGMILRIASSRIVGQGDIVGRSGYFSLNLSANSVMRGRLDARRTLKSLVADLRMELFDAVERFKIKNVFYGKKSDCSAGEILKGKMNPLHCQAFGTRCTPEHPLGALMVSTEGACAAYYRYRR